MAHDKKFILATAHDLLNRRINWPDARCMTGNEFEVRTFDLVAAWSACDDPGTVSRIALVIWHILQAR